MKNLIQVTAINEGGEDYQKNPTNEKKEVIGALKKQRGSKLSIVEH